MDLNETSGLLFNCIISQTFFLSLPIAYLSSLCWCCAFSGENKRDDSDKRLIFLQSTPADFQQQSTRKLISKRSFLNKESLVYSQSRINCTLE